MNVHSFFHEYPRYYGKFYIGGHQASIKLACVAELVSAVHPQYTHKDIYYYLTEKSYRQSILKKLQKSKYCNIQQQRRNWLKY